MIFENEDGNAVPAGHITDTAALLEQLRDQANGISVYSKHAIEHLAALTTAQYAEVKKQLAEASKIGKKPFGLRDLQQSLREHRQSKRQQIRVAEPSEGPPAFADIFDDWEGLTAPPADLQFPIGYCVNERGVARWVDNPETGARELNIIAHAPVILTKRLVDIHLGTIHLELAWWVAPDRKWVARIVSREEIKDERLLLRLSKYGFPADTHNKKHLIKYLTELEYCNVDTLRTSAVTSHMGWQEPDCRSFVIGRKSYGLRTVSFKASSPGDEQLADSYASTGSLEGWVDAISELRAYPLVRLGVIASMATPLLQILRVPGFVVDYAHSTSTGKTTALSVAASVWSDPCPWSANSTISSWDTTAVWLERAAATRCNLPMLIDETKRASKGSNGQSIVPQVIYALTNGQGRTRGTIEGLATRQTWLSIAITTGEQRATDFSQDGGLLPRVLSVWGPPFGAHSPRSAAVIASVTAHLRDNFGHAGPAMVRYILENRDFWDMWRDEHAETARNFAQKLGQQMPGGVAERLASHMAVIEVAAEIAATAVGSHYISHGVCTQLFDTILNEASCSSRVDTALAMIASRVLELEHWFKGREEDRTPPRWLGRWDQDTSTMAWREIHIYPNVLKEWLENAGFEPVPMCRQLAEAGHLVSETNDRSIQGRTRIDGKRVRVFTFPRKSLLPYLA